jgi:hypothetical protein
VLTTWEISVFSVSTMPSGHGHGIGSRLNSKGKVESQRLAEMQRQVLAEDLVKPGAAGAHLVMPGLTKAAA